LFIFITPRVVRDDAEMERMMEDYRGRAEELIELPPVGGERDLGVSGVSCKPGSSALASDTTRGPGQIGEMPDPKVCPGGGPPT
jgi:hypothetical protein